MTAKKSGTTRKNTRASDKAKAKSSSKADRISRIIDQAKEPLGLIDTLKEEGLARAGYLLGVAAGTASTLTRESVKSQVKDLAKNLGLVTKKEHERLLARVEDLESRFEAIEEHFGLSVVDADSEDATEDLIADDDIDEQEEDEDVD